MFPENEKCVQLWLRAGAFKKFDIQIVYRSIDLTCVRYKNLLKSAWRWDFLASFPYLAPDRKGSIGHEISKNQTPSIYSPLSSAYFPYICICFTIFIMVWKNPWICFG